jgi:hypothetical protein
MSIISRRERLRRALDSSHWSGEVIAWTDPTEEGVQTLHPLRHDPAARAEDFHRWMLERCVWRDRCFGGIGALHTSFCEWAMSSHSVPCQRKTFERLLADAGFLVADGLVSGLISKADLWALEPSPSNLQCPQECRDLLAAGKRIA